LWWWKAREAFLEAKELKGGSRCALLGDPRPLVALFSGGRGRVFRQPASEKEEDGVEGEWRQASKGAAATSAETHQPVGEKTDRDIYSLLTLDRQ
jgi:hypothetical protein